jgi:hypothetical protein
MKKFLFLFGALAALFAIIEPASAGHIIDSLTAIPVDGNVILATAPLTLVDLRNEASNLSNFSGDYYGGGMYSNYTGQGDDLLSFAGSIQNFSGELVEHLEKQFVITIVNANAAKRTALLFAGYMKGNTTLAPGQLIEGAFNDTAGAAGLTGATASEKSIEELQLFINTVPTRLLAIKIKSTDANQVSESFTYQRLSPFQTLPTKILRPDNFQNQDTFQDKIATFPANVQMDDQAQIKLPVVGSSTVRVSFFFGTSINLALTLERRAAQAHANINAKGQQAVINESVANKALGA